MKMSNPRSLPNGGEESSRDSSKKMNEKTPLIVKPSPSSTDNPSWNNLADCEQAAEDADSLLGIQESDSEISLPNLSYRNSEGERISEYGLSTRRRNRLGVIVTNLALFSAGFLFFATVWHFALEPVFNPSNNNDPSKKDLSSHLSSFKEPKSFSQLDPVNDLGLVNFQRPQDSRPPSSVLEMFEGAAIPTNAWYQNLLSVDDIPSTIHRAYTIPYIVDAAGPIPGLRMHANHIVATQTVIQLSVNEQDGLVVGAAPAAAAAAAAASAASASASEGNSPLLEDEMNTRFHVENMTPLAITLGWEEYPMSSPIVKGMPYATMRYESLNGVGTGGQVLFPTVASELPFGDDQSVVVVDGAAELHCHDVHSLASSEPMRVERELEIFIPSNDFTWLVFFSEPVLVRCSPMEGSGGGMLQVVGSDRADGEEDDSPFFIRTTILNTCTTGKNPIYCNPENLLPPSEDYDQIIRSNAHLFPGPNADFSYEFNKEEEETKVLLQFDWDVQDMRRSSQSMSSVSTNTSDSQETADLVMFSLLHHRDMMDYVPSPSDADDKLHCASSLNGPTCLLSGSSWDLMEEMPDVSFRAPRPPAPWAIPAIAESLKEDITYTLPDYFQRGAGDTYFSGKMLARLARVLLINEELDEICNGHDVTAWEQDLDNSTNPATYADACSSVELPTANDFSRALDSLRSSVEVWINGTAETPFVFDSAWGGVVSCGCNFDGTSCQNKFPDCPAFYNTGLNFGNAFYNDMHFHYGYHIFAAAAVAHFDHEWGKRYFENVLLLIRNIANPSREDSYFPIMRHKDVFQGHSWANGISRPFLNGKNQESSSEAIAAYESVALYGKAMAEVFGPDQRASQEYEAAKEVRNVGKLMTAMELRSTKRYYHVRQGSSESSTGTGSDGSSSGTSDSRIFPTVYTPHVVGIMWQTMAQFQTWFGNAPYLAYGIQLMPLTSIAEERDSVDWAKEMYPALAASCDADGGCAEGGWSVVELASMATVGHAQEAFERAQATLSSQTFDSAGGNGHSMSNTLWYIATRPPVAEPLRLPDKKAPSSTTSHFPGDDHELTDCHCPTTCTDTALDTKANLYSCRERIQWVMDSFHKTQMDACVQVAALDFPDECGPCDPLRNGAGGEDNGAAAGQDDVVPACPPCTEKQCKSELNRCPAYERSFVCTDGRNTGGCSQSPWPVQHDGDVLCAACCELTNCPPVSPTTLPETTPAVDTPPGNDNDGKIKEDLVDHCDDCSRETCRGENAPPMPLCPVAQAPYLCQSGSSIGGCSPRPWSLLDGQCEKCCKLTPGCSDP